MGFASSESRSRSNTVVNTKKVTKTNTFNLNNQGTEDVNNNLNSFDLTNRGSGALNVSTTDFGSVGAAIDLSQRALDVFDSVNSQTLQFAQGASENALDFALNSTDDDDTNSFDKLVKWGTLAASAIAVIVFINNK